MVSSSSKLILLSSLSLTLAKTADLPRGVSPDRLHLYAPNADGIFSCHANPQYHISISQVNDDYCDCPDGSDEPGTSACSHLSPQNLSLPGFYCENKHHKPTYIAFSRVNDGICDYDECCDGSDEWAGVGGVACENKCKEIGKEARRIADEKRKALENGRRKYAEYLAKAGQLRKQIEDEVETVKGVLVDLEKDLEVKKNELALADVEERSKVVKSDEKKGKVSVLAQLAKERIEEYKDSAALLLKKKTELATKLEKAEAILKGLKDAYNPNFNDEGVKTAVRAWEEYLAAQEGFVDEDPDLDAGVEDLMNDEINWEEWEGVDEEPEVIEEIYQIEKYLPESIRSWIHSQLNTLRTVLIENGILAHRDTAATSGQPSARLTAAQSAVSDVESTIASTRSRQETIQSDLDKEYGVLDVFRALKGECIETSSGEYTYEHCFMEKAHQKSNKDGSRTHLGNYHNYELLTEEDGTESVILNYKNGARCWNGPARSAIVRLRCTAEETIETVFEEEKCVYKFEAGSAAVCGGVKGQEVHNKDEL